MLRNGVKRDNTSKTNPNIGLTKSFAQRVSSSDSYDLQSAKESNHITHTATSDRKRAAFATTLKNPYWDENHLWKDAFLVYSYKHPEDCLGPPANKSDKTIRFNSRFESGNLLYAYRLNPDVYHCILEYDHSTASQCQWFYFQMSNIKTIPNSNRKMTFYISGFNKASGVFSTGSKVFMYSEKLAKEKNIGWFRTGTNYAYGTISSKTDDSSFLDCEPDKENNKKKKGITKQHKLKRSTLQFQITFPYDDDVVYLCYAQPYTFTDLNMYITNWIRTSPSLITKSTLCKTYGGKDCPLLTITAPNSPSASKKKCIFVTARIHPGESNGSIVLHGLIDYLLSKQPLTTYLLDHFIFKIVPMVNIDGVIEGFYRVGLEGEDLNRVWNQPDPRIHPVVYHTKNLMYELNKKMGIAAYIDFHGHSREHGTFAYGCPWEENENLPQNMINKEKVLPKIISSLCDAFSFEKCVFSIPQKRKDASRCVVRRELGVVNSFTIESSFGGITAGLWGNTLYNEFIWKEIGAKIGEGLFHLFSDPSSQTLKTAENQIAAAAALVKPGFSQIESQTIRERPIVKKKAKSKSEKEENKIVIAIDTQDGIKVISTETKAPPSSSANNQTLTSTGNTSTLRLNHNNTNGITVIQKVEQNQPIETIYTLKITDLSSYSSSSSPSPVPASARVKRNPRINMNKKLNSTLNNNNDSKQLQICNSTENTAQNRRSNLSQRSNASLYSSSRLNEIRISSSSSHSNLINDTNPILVTTNDGQISCSNSTPRVVEIKVSHMNSSILDTSFENTNNSILIPSVNDDKNTNTNTNQNQNANSNENQKPSSSLKARNNRIQKSGSTSNTNTNPNSNSNSESNQSANTKNQSEVITNKIVKPNTNSNRNSNPGSVSKPTKLISKPNTNTATKVSIILNPNQSQQQETNFVPNPPSNRNESQKPNPHSSTNVAANAKATPHPPQQPLDSAETINSTAKSNQTSNTINIDQKQNQPTKSNQTSNTINQDQKQTQTTKSNQNIKQVQSSNAAASNSKTNQQSNTTSNQIPKQTQPNQTQIQSTNQNQSVKPTNNSKPTTPPKTENAKANTQSNIESAKSTQVSNQENAKTNTSSNAEIARTNSSQNPKSTTNVKQNPTPAATKETAKQTQQQNQTINQASNSKSSQQQAQTSTKNTTTKPNQTQNSAATQNNKQNQPQISQTNSNAKPIQQSNTAANQVQPQAAKNSNVKPSQPSNTESNVKTNPQQEIAANQQNAKTSQPTNTNAATKPNTTTTTTKPNQPQNTAANQNTKQNQPQPNQPQNTAANQNAKSNQPQPTTTSTKPNTPSNTTAAQTKPNPQQNTQTTTAKPNPQQNTTTTAAKPNTPSNTATAQTKPNPQQNTQTTTTAKPNTQSNTTTKPNTSNTQAAAAATKPTQNSNTTEKQQTPSPTKINQSQSLYKNDNQKQILTTNKIEKSKTVTDLPTDSTTKQIQPSSNPKPNPRMNHITNLVPATKPATFYDDDDFGSNSYLSTQSDLDSFSFLHQEDITEISETNLFNYSTATFNSSSTYASPTKSPKLSPHEKSQQKSQDVKQTKTKKSHNSKTPKRK